MIRSRLARFLFIGLPAPFLLIGGYSMLGAQKYQGHVNYTLAEKKDGYEIRQYFPYFQAELSVAAPYYSQALSKGADELNRYLRRRENTRERVVRVTYPFVARELEAEEAAKYPRFVPVKETVEKPKDYKSYVVTIALDDTYTRASIPKPWNPFIFLREIPTRPMAVRTFGGWITEDKVEKEIEAFKADLQRDGVQYKELRVGDWNDMWMLFWRKNEIQAVLSDKSDKK